MLKVNSLWNIKLRSKYSIDVIIPNIKPWTYFFLVNSLLNRYPDINITMDIAIKINILLVLNPKRFVILNKIDIIIKEIKGIANVFKYLNI